MRILLSILLLAASSASLASKSLDEPKDIARQVRRVPAAAHKAAWAAGAVEGCSPLIVYSAGLVGLRCRLAVLAHQAKTAKADASGLEMMLEVARLAEHATRSVSGYEPLRRTRGFADQRVQAHTQGCRTLMASFDRIQALPEEGELKEQRALALGRFGRDERGIGYAACACAARSLELLPPDAPTTARGAFQAELTSRGCFLDQSKLAAKRGGPKLEFSGRAAGVAAGASVEAALRSYADSRAFELKRCTDKHAPLGTVKVPAKLEKCACRAVKRWRFPSEKGRAPVTFVVPVAKLELETLIGPTGRVQRCGAQR